MSPCYICGGPIDELRLDPRDMKTRPCSTCENVIHEMAFGRDDEIFDEDDEEFLHTSLEDYLG